MINHWQIWRQKILLFIYLLHWILNPHSSPDLANAKFMFHSLPGPWLEPCTFKFSVHPAFWEGKRGLEKGIDVVKIQQLYLLQKVLKVGQGAGSLNHLLFTGRSQGCQEVGTTREPGRRRRLVSSRPPARAAGTATERGDRQGRRLARSARCTSTV